MDGIRLSISAADGAGVVGFCPFLIAALALLDWRGRLRVSIGNGTRSPFCAELAPLLEDIVSICCGKALVIGRRSLGVYATCGDGIGGVLPGIGNASGIPAAKEGKDAY